MVSGAFISAHKCLPSTEFLAPVTFSRRKKKHAVEQPSLLLGCLEGAECRCGLAAAQRSAETVYTVHICAACLHNGAGGFLISQNSRLVGVGAPKVLHDGRGATAAPAEHPPERGSRSRSPDMAPAMHLLVSTHTNTYACKTSSETRNRSLSPHVSHVVCSTTYSRKQFGSALLHRRTCALLVTGKARSRQKISEPCAQ